MEALLKAMALAKAYVATLYYKLTIRALRYAQKNIVFELIVDD